MVLPENRIYNHINIQPVVHLEPGGQTAKGPLARVRDVRQLRRRRHVGRGRVRDDVREGRRRLEDQQPRLPLGLRRAVRDGLGAARAAAGAAGGGGSGRAGHATCRIRPISRATKRAPGFPAACVGPFHYTNPGVTDAGHVWTTGHAAGRDRAQAGRARPRADLAARAQRLADEQEVENLQKIYGYYYDRRMWDDVADLFADDGTIEMGQRGVYVGKARVREFLNLLGPVGLERRRGQRSRAAAGRRRRGAGRSHGEGAQPRAEHDRRVREATASGAKASTRTRSSRTTASGRSRICATSRRSSPTTTRVGRPTRNRCDRRARSCRPIGRRRACTRSIRRRTSRRITTTIP